MPERRKVRSHLQRKWRMQVSNKKKKKKKPSTSETRRDAFIYKKFWRSLLLLLSCFGILAAFRSAVWCNFRHLKVPPFFFFSRGREKEIKGATYYPLFIPTFEPALRPATGGPFFGGFPSVCRCVAVPQRGAAPRCAYEAAHIHQQEGEKSEESKKKKAACGCPRGEGRLAGQRPTSQTPAPLPNLLFCSSLGWLMNAGPLQQQSERTRPALNLVFLPFQGRQLGLARRPSPIVLQSE